MLLRPILHNPIQMFLPNLFYRPHQVLPNFFQIFKLHLSPIYHPSITHLSPDLSPPSPANPLPDLSPPSDQSSSNHSSPAHHTSAFAHPTSPSSGNSSSNHSPPSSPAPTTSLADNPLGSPGSSSGHSLHAHSPPPLSPPPKQGDHREQPSRRPCSWEDLDAGLQSVLPPNEKYSYVLEEIIQKQKAELEGAPLYCFQAVIRINMSTEVEAKQWLEELMTHSRTTYRVTRTFKPGLKRIKCKFEMHCQHRKKKLTPKQMQQSALAKSRYPLTHTNRDKKTQCPANLTLVVQIPTKKQHIMAEKWPYLLTHTGVLHITFCHNHPLASGHTLSFRDVCSETKEAIQDLFSIGHSASTARHVHEQQLMNHAETEADMQLVLADRLKNPLVHDVCRLYRKWQESTYRKDDGRELFESLQDRVTMFNDTFSSQNGKAKLQWYEAGHKVLSDDESNDDVPKKKKLKSGTPLIYCVCVLHLWSECTRL